MDGNGFEVEETPRHLPRTLSNMRRTASMDLALGTQPRLIVK